jgi:outer membrane lipase/esterase
MNNIEHPHLGFLLSLSLLFSGWAGADFAYDGLVVFGDSLSDSGNKYVVTGLSNTPPYDLLDPTLVPDGPYTKGGLHHSNGKTWVEQYAQPLDLGDLVRPALRNPGEATNYAYGGARARDASATSTNLNLPEQVMTFLADTGGVASPDALHVIFIGGNDIAPDAVTAFATIGPGVGIGIIIDAFVSVGDRMVELYTAGARKFLIMNVPDMGLIPAMNPPLNVPEVWRLGTCLSVLYNYGSPLPFRFDQLCTPFPFPPGIPGLDAVLDQLEVNLPGIEIIRFDMFERLQQIVESPEDFGLLEEVEPCVDPNVPPYACKRPDTYVFWDGVHPTKAVHAIIANEVGMVLAE